MAAMNTADIGFEKEIWKAADKMRGNIDASEYKSVVLGLIFLKYISDKFEAKYQQLVAEGEGFEEDKDEYLSNKNEKGSYDPVFYVPAEARWEAIAIHAHSPEIGTIIDNAMRAIEKENKRLKDILPKNFARPELDKRRLGEVVDLFTNIRMHEHGDSKDILGRAYEYCLSKFAEAEGKLAGEFYTPACIVKTLVNVLQPYKGRVYDPCCGSGGMFVQSAQFIESHSGNINNISVYGQDSNPTTWKMAQMNLAIRGIEADLGRYNADTFFNDCHPTLKADFVMANPPFNLSDWGRISWRMMCVGNTVHRPMAMPTLRGFSISSTTLPRRDVRALCWPTARCRARVAVRVKSGDDWSKRIWLIVLSLCRRSYSILHRFPYRFGFSIKQAAKGQNALYRRSQLGYNGNAQVARTD